MKNDGLLFRDIYFDADNFSSFKTSSKDEVADLEDKDGRGSKYSGN